MEVNYHKRYLHSQYMNWLVNFSTESMSQIDWGKKDTRTGGKISLLANSSSVSGIVKKWTFGSINLQWQEDELTTSWRLNLCRHSVRNHCHWWIGKVHNLHAWAREQREREKERPKWVHRIQDYAWPPMSCKNVEANFEVSLIRNLRTDYS